MIGVPIPSWRAVSITRQPSRPGSIRSRTQTSGRSKRRRASPVSPFAASSGLKPEAARARFLIEESRELVLVLDDERTLLAASRRAREVFPGLAVGSEAPAELLEGGGDWTPVVV